MPDVQTLELAVVQLARETGLDIKALRLAVADVLAIANNAGNTSVALINDEAGDGVIDKTWSADKITDAILSATNTLRDSLTAGASAALDTFAEVAQKLAEDETLSSALATRVSVTVRYDEAQTLTLEQKGIARTNIGAASEADFSTLVSKLGNVQTDFLTVYTTARDA